MLTLKPGAYATDTVTIILEPNKGIEYKYQIKKGDTMIVLDLTDKLADDKVEFCEPIKL